MDHSGEDETPHSQNPQALLDAESAIQRGDRQRAYQLGLQASQIAPENIKTWLICAETAPTLQEALACLNRANTLKPLDPEAKQKTYKIIQNLLSQDPYLQYLDETDDLYHVRSGEQFSLIVPKGRAIPEPASKDKSGSLRQTYLWLGIALLGLPFAGLGAMVFAPLAAAWAIGMNIKSTSRTKRIHSFVVIMLSGGLWLCGLLLGVILLMHMI